MEGELWPGLYGMVKDLGKKHRSADVEHSNAWIVLVYLWAVLHDRPVCWACRQSNWPGPWQDRNLPSASCMSRRLRSPAVLSLMNDLEQTYRKQFGRSLFRSIDARPLPIGGSSGDPQAGYGRAAASKAKGYKFYAILDSTGGIDAWRGGPMNYSERTMARRLLRDLDAGGYLTGDGEYDDAKLYHQAGRQGLQLIAIKRRGERLGHRRQDPHRLRGIELQAGRFGQSLLKDRARIDRFFGAWQSAGVGLKHPPAWVRTHRRVRLWVQAKLILRYVHTLKQRLTAQMQNPRKHGASGRLRPFIRPPRQVPPSSRPTLPIE